MASYLEGDLALDKRALFDAHLDDCAGCALEISEMQETIAVLRSLPNPDVPAHLADNALRRIRNGEAKPPWYDHVRDALAALLSPRILAPVSAGMLAMGVITYFGEIQLSGAGSPEPAPAPQVVRVEPRSGGDAIASNRAAQRLAANRSGVQVDRRADPLGPSDQWMRELDSLIGGMRGGQRFGPPLASAPQTVQVAGGTGQGYAPPRYGAEGQSLVQRQRAGGLGDRELPSAEDWLLHAQRSPAAFAAELYLLTLAEQELWVDNLARRASAQGDLERVIASLQSSQSEQARLLAQDFRAAAERMITASATGSSDR
jgi:hypothetical protein